MTFRRLLPTLALAGALATSAAHAAPIERVTSPGGIEAWLIEDHLAPVISLQVAFRGESVLDPAGQDGLSRFVSSLLDESGGDDDSQAFQRRIEDLAGQIGFGAGRQAFTGDLKTLERNRDPMADLFKTAITRPRFDAPDVERVRRQIQVSIARDSEDPAGLGYRIADRIAFAGHPLARDTRGTKQSIAALGPTEFRSFVAERLTRDALVVGVAGAISKAELAPLLDRVFGALPAKPPTPRPALAPVTPAGAGEIVVLKKPLPQTFVLMVGPGLSQDDPDFYAAQAANYILGGGGLTSRLTDEVREKRGLAYGVSSGLWAQLVAPQVAVSTRTKSSETGRTIEVIRDVMAKMAKDGITDAELTDAKTYLTGSFPLQFDTTGRIASLLVQMQLDRRPIDQLDRRPGLINAVTLDQVNRVARRLFSPERFLTVVVGDPSGVTPTRPVPDGI